MHDKEEITVFAEDAMSTVVPHSSFLVPRITRLDGTHPKENRGLRGSSVLSASAAYPVGTHL